MTKMKIKKNDTVFVIAGDDKGKSGKVIKVFPKKSRVIVEGVAVRKKTVRRSAAYPNGGIMEQEMSIHVSNVMSEDRYQAREERKRARQDG